MKIIATDLSGLYEIENKKFRDERGLFVKTFNLDDFVDLGLEVDFKESFYSVSKKNVLRGMHFQLPPHDHAKLIYVVDGEILDVAVDVRRNSATFGRYYAINLSSENAKSLYMAKGFAHGFLTLTDSATVVYMITSTHAPSSDTGISWDSFGFNWNGIKEPIVSERDSLFLELNSFYAK